MSLCLGTYRKKRMKYYFVLIFFCSLAGLEGHAKISCDDHLNSAAGIFSNLKNSEYRSIKLRENNIEVTGLVNQALARKNKMMGRIGFYANQFMNDVVGRDVKTVFYPASGSDAVTAFKIFEEAELIVGLDNNPFIADVNQESIAFLPVSKTRESFDMFSEVNFANGSNHSAAEIILTDLKFLYPELVVESLEVISSASLRKSGSYALGGRIQFRPNPAGPLKTYIHLQLPLIGQITKKNDIGYEYIVEQLLGYKFDAVLAKASMSFFSPNETYYSSQEIPYSIGMKVMKQLRDSKGVFVNADGEAMMPNLLSGGLSASRTLKYSISNIFEDDPLDDELDYASMGIFGYASVRRIEIITFF